MKVIIIGGGTGGMCLAHGLKRAGIPAMVLERYRDRADGLFGYRVGIDPTGSKALRECLPSATFDLFLATCARRPTAFNVLTQRMHATALIGLPEPAVPSESEQSVSRAVFRQVLFTGMDDVVEFGKTFTHYEDNADGTLTAHCDDGSRYLGDVLVAADGTRSAVRAQYLPDAQIREAGVIAIATKTALTAEVRAWLPAHVFGAVNMIFGTRGMVGVLHAMEFPWDERGLVRPGTEPRARQLIEAWPHSRDGAAGDYVNLSVMTSADRYPRDVMQRRGADVIQVALDMTTNWHPSLRRLISRSDPASAFPVNVLTSVPIEPWPTTNVTLLGDALHTMTPGHGVGANTALRDATLLCRALTSVQSGQRQLRDALSDYEQQVIPYGFERVRDSLNQNATRGNDPLYRPATRRLALFATRTYFSLTSKIPSMGKKFIDSLAEYRGADF